jgi:diguanylate cyclase (GGDEF)-like protein/PAS domain S-box-containing protein
MKLPLLRPSHVITAAEVFRFASLFLYITLGVQVAIALIGLSGHAMLVTLAAAGGLACLFLMALLRLRPRWPAPRGALALLEMLAVLAVVGILARPEVASLEPLPWLLGIAGIFPLALAPAAAVFAVVTLVLVGFPLADGLGVAPVAWLPNAAAVVFVGLLSGLLSKALAMSFEAIGRAYTNERRFNAIARATRHVFMITDANFRVKYVNPALHDVIGYNQADLEQDSQLPVIHPEDVESHRKKLRFLHDKSGSRIFSRHRARHKDGHWVWFESRGYNMLHDSAIGGLVFSIEDITARIEAEHRLEEEHGLLRAVLDLNPSMIYAKDPEGRFTISNASFQRQFGYSAEEELRGKNTFDLLAGAPPDNNGTQPLHSATALHQQDMQVMQSGVPMENLETLGFLDGDVERWFLSNKYPLRDAQDRIVGVLGITRDVTERKQYEIRLEHQALHDFLTGLPNRRYLLKKIAELAAVGKTEPVSVLFCDLDFFKSVNDTHGHEVGDKCLIEITRRIQAELQTSDFLSRYGGDEFVVVIAGDLLEAGEKAQHLLHMLSRPLIIGDVIVKIQASMGIAQFGKEHKSASDLIRDADAAMYQAKERGRSRLEIFDFALQNHVTRRAQMDVALRFALERDELSVNFQPKVLLRDGSVNGFELLLRWNSVQYGEISPNEFIPVAEASGLIVPIGLWALEQACWQLKRWQDTGCGLEKLTVSVNVSMKQLLQPIFLDDVAATIARTGILPQTLELEMTETSAMANPMQTVETLWKLKKLGVRIALDDFGTGYSSLAYLQKLPIDVLKIDKAFVMGVGREQSDTAIVRLVLALAKTLNLETVAEGVESKEQLEALRMLGCEVGQGYFFSAALAAHEAEGLLETTPQHFLVA